MVPRQAPRTPPLAFRGEIAGDRDFRTTACGVFAHLEGDRLIESFVPTPRYHYKRQNGGNVTRYFKYFSKTDVAGWGREFKGVFCSERVVDTWRWAHSRHT